MNMNLGTIELVRCVADERERGTLALYGYGTDDFFLLFALVTISS